jgi:hypothetical protein
MTLQKDYVNLRSLLFQLSGVSWRIWLRLSRSEEYCALRTVLKLDWCNGYYVVVYTAVKYQDLEWGLTACLKNVVFPVNFNSILKIALRIN